MRSSCPYLFGNFKLLKGIHFFSTDTLNIKGVRLVLIGGDAPQRAHLP